MGIRLVQCHLATLSPAACIFFLAALFSHVPPAPPLPLCTCVTCRGAGGVSWLSHMSTRVFTVGLHVRRTLYICEWGMLV